MTIFSKIINGDIPCYKIAENEHFFAFLDIRPMQSGHTLVVPKTEKDYIFDLDDTTLQAMIIFAKRVAEGIKSTIPCERVTMSVLGLEVPHAHIHLVPINSLHDLDFTKPRVKLTPDEYAHLAKEISEKV